MFCQNMGKSQNDKTNVYKHFWQIKFKRFSLFYACRTYIKIRVIDDEEYEKNETFYLEIGEPVLTHSGAGINTIFFIMP